MKPHWKKGVVLLQTMIMSLLLSMIAVMLMKWVLARYIMASRSYRSTTSVARSSGFSQDYFSRWNFVASVPSCGGSLDGQDLSCNIGDPAALTSMRTIEITSNEDQ